VATGPTSGNVRYTPQAAGTYESRSELRNTGSRASLGVESPHAAHRQLSLPLGVPRPTFRILALPSTSTRAYVVGEHSV